MPTKRTTTTTTKKVEEVNPTEEIVVEETPVDVEEDFNLEKKVTVRSIAEWTTGFQRIETNDYFRSGRIPLEHDEMAYRT